MKIWTSAPVFHNMRAMDRNHLLNRISLLFGVNPVVALLGPRQAGKTTLARAFVSAHHPDLPERNYFDLEDPSDLARLEQPKLALEPLRGLVVIDEIQRTPELFPLLRTLVDRPDRPARFLILGSASRELIRESSESLAGRISYLEVHPFGAKEVGPPLEHLWLRGGFPPSYLAPDDETSFLWREGYVRTYLERDIPQLGFQIPAAAIRRLWLMLTHHHGQILNVSELAGSLQVDAKTVQRHLDILAGTFMVRRLVPWYENIAKRQVKRNKVYFRDSGVLHYFLGVRTWDELHVHPKLGASWEGFALEEVIRALGATESEAYFWAVHREAELDLLVVKDGKRLGFEFKYSDAPKLTRSMQQARDLLSLDSLTVICPDAKPHSLDSCIEALGLEQWLSP